MARGEEMEEDAGERQDTKKVIFQIGKLKSSPVSQYQVFDIIFSFSTLFRPVCATFCSLY